MYLLLISLVYFLLLYLLLLMLYQLYRDKWKLDLAFNASFTSLNVAKVTMKEMGMEYSMSSFKSLMTNIYLVKRIFKASGYT